MPPQQAIEILKQFNAWRRDDTDLHEQPDPRLVGVAIDVAIRVLEAREMETIDNI